jgi:hypothetical protein
MNFCGRSPAVMLNGAKAQEATPSKTSVVRSRSAS